MKRPRPTKLAMEVLERRTPLAGDLGHAAGAFDVPKGMVIDSTGVFTWSTAPGRPGAQDRIGLLLELTRPDGMPLKDLSVGEEFVLRVSAADARTPARGVSAAYLDILWDSTKAVATGPVQFDNRYYHSFYGNGRSGDVSTPGLIDEAGAFAGLTDLGPGIKDVFLVAMRAVGSGTLVFAAAPADGPTHGIRVYDDPIEAGGQPDVSPDDVSYRRAATFVRDALPVSETPRDPGTVNPTSDRWPAPPPPNVELSIQLTDPNGSPIINVGNGQDFVLHVFARDWRNWSYGVFAAYLDVQWDGNQAVVTGPLRYGSTYVNGHSGDTSFPGLIDDAGGFAGLAEVGAGRYEVFCVPMRAVGSGVIFFRTDRSDLPGHDVLVGVRTPDPAHVSPSVVYGTASILVTDPVAPGDFGAGGQLPSPADPRVAVTLQITASDGSSLTTLRPGQDFVLHAFVEDLRGDARGVFAAVLDVLWDSSKAIMTGPVKYGASYSGNIRWEDTSTPGLIDEAGSFAGQTELGAGPRELFSVLMRAASAGNLLFASDPADSRPDHDTLLYGEYSRVDWTEIRYGTASITVTAPDANEPPTASSEPDSGVSQPPWPAPSADDSSPANDGDSPAARDPAASSPVVSPDSNKLAAIQLEIVDAAGQPASSVRVGDQFELRALLITLAPQPFAANTDVRFDSTLVMPLDAPGDIGFRWARVLPAELDEAGRIMYFDWGGKNSNLIISKTFMVTKEGLAIFESDPADQYGNDILVLGLNQAVPLSQVTFGSTTLQIKR